MRPKKIIDCPLCKRKIAHCAQGLCRACYTRTATPQIICMICGKKRPHHAKKMCGSCYSKTFHYDRIKEFNVQNYHGISLKEWNEITEKCILCGFDKIVELHHLDGNKKNSQRNNLMGLCPNHHKMLHNEKYKDETTKEILKKLNKE